MHAEVVIQERGIRLEWIEATLAHPDRREDIDDTVHYLKKIAAFGGRWLRVVVSKEEPVVITVFFDWRVR